LNSQDPSLQIVESLVKVKEDGLEITNTGKLVHQLDNGSEVIELIGKSQNTPTVGKELLDEEMKVAGEQQKVFAV